MHWNAGSYLSECSLQGCNFLLGSCPVVLHLPQVAYGVSQPLQLPSLLLYGAHLGSGATMRIVMGPLTSLLLGEHVQQHNVKVFACTPAYLHKCACACL